MATMASAARDIPQASFNRDNLTVVADRNGSATVARPPSDLPTPPNSISPALPAHGLKAQLQKANLEAVDSDLDLHRDDETASKRSVSPAIDASGAITCALLAKHHLPDILLDHGPLAIRHIMGYLTTSVPGFSAIPPNKARRLTVGALEGRGGEGGGVDGDVEFEKVGWGRWDAKRRGLARKASSPDPSAYLSGIPIGGARQDRLKVNSDDSFQFSHDDHDDNHMMVDIADNMSMDDSGTASCSEAPDDIMMDDDDSEDMTDDEDWAAMGAAALRAESYPDSGAAERDAHFSGMRSFSYGCARPPQPNMDFALAGPSDAQEREAVEALLRLGSV